MITIKGFAIVPKKINLTGDDRYGKHIYSPVQEVYSSKEEAEEALRLNHRCYFTTSDMEIKEVEVNIK